LKGVDGHPCEILIGRGVYAEVEIDQFFLDWIASGRCKDNLRVETRGINACSSVADDLLYNLFAIVLLVGVGHDALHVFLQVVELVFLAAVEVYFLPCLLLLGGGVGRVEAEILDCKHH
jgi:hypothetical protein